MPRDPEWIVHPPDPPRREWPWVVAAWVAGPLVALVLHLLGV